MESLIAAAARALAAGDPLGALKRIALRDEPSALALRGIAMAQLGDYAKARALLRRAARGFGARERLAQARCQVAEAEVALAARDFSRPPRSLDAVAQALDALGDRANAFHARLIGVRRQLLVGEIDAAEQALAAVDFDDAAAPLALVARAELTRAELALRRVRAADAAAALGRANAAATAAGIPALVAEIARARRTLSAPAARLIGSGVTHTLRLAEVEGVLASHDLVVDALRHTVRARTLNVPLAGRPVLFALASALAEAWPNDVVRDSLIERVFRTRHADESHRARLRVELGRLRAALRPLARIEATPRGFAIRPLTAPSIVVLAPPTEGLAGAILALLEDGGTWSTSTLARALGASQRTVQRALLRLEESLAVRAAGNGRARRWFAPALGEYTTNLLLPGVLPSG
ncbi:helix-turn-helix domain-containing protein [Metallibacterium scheffleri]